jgi:subtilisin family serine protease
MASVGGASARRVVPGGYIVVLKDGVDAAAVVREHKKRFGAQVQFVYSNALLGYSATLDGAAVAAIGGDPRMQWVEQDEAFDGPREPRPPAVPHAPQPEQRLSIGLDRVDAEQSSAASGDGRGAVGINVAVLDTGLARKHPDLNIGGGFSCVPGDRSADLYDRNGHGSAVGGLIGALDNAIGRVGVAPGATLFGVRVLDLNGEGTDSMVLCGIDWVASTRTNSDKNDDIAVANMSLGGLGDADDGNCGRTVHDALHLGICHTTDLGVTFVASAMNDSSDFAGVDPATYHEVLTVTAVADYDGQPGGLASPTCDSLGADDSAATFSNFATLAADQVHTVAAPGVWLGSTYLSRGTRSSSAARALPRRSSLARSRSASTPARARECLRRRSSRRSLRTRLGITLATPTTASRVTRYDRTAATTTAT